MLISLLALLRDATRDYGVLLEWPHLLRALLERAIES